MARAHRAYLCPRCESRARAQWIIALYYLGIGQKKDAVAGPKTGKGVPWFAFGFVAVATINSIWGIAPHLQKLLTTASACFLASAMAALGLDSKHTAPKPAQGPSSVFGLQPAGARLMRPHSAVH